MSKIDIGVIRDWWDDLTEEERKESMFVLDVLSDKESPKRAWLQIMVGYFGARFVRSYIRIMGGKSLS